MWIHAWPYPSARLVDYRYRLSIAKIKFGVALPQVNSNCRRGRGKLLAPGCERLGRPTSRHRVASRPWNPAVKFSPRVFLSRRWDWLRLINVTWHRGAGAFIRDATYLFSRRLLASCVDPWSWKVAACFFFPLSDGSPQTPAATIPIKDIDRAHRVPEMPLNSRGVATSASLTNFPVSPRNIAGRTLALNGFPVARRRASRSTGLHTRKKVRPGENLLRSRLMNRHPRWERPEKGGPHATFQHSARTRFVKSPFFSHRLTCYFN